MEFRQGSNELDTFVLVLPKHCQADLALFEPCLMFIIGGGRDESAPIHINLRKDDKEQFHLTS
jgi:hypothetical protein